MILPKNNLKTLKWAGFSVMLYIIISEITHLPEPIIWVMKAIILILLFRGTKKYASFKAIDKYGYIITSVFILWLFLGFLRGCYYAEGYWMWKFLINSLFTTSFYCIILLGANPYWLQGIYQMFWKYYLPLMVIVILFLHSPSYLNYLPYSTLLIFFPIIPKQKRMWLLGIVFLFFITQEQRNDMVKMLMAFCIGMSITYCNKKIITPIFRLMHIVLLLLPIVLLFLGITGKFNVFKMDEYIKGDYHQTIRKADGEIQQDNLKADTRTFLYWNVFYTMKKYDAWIIGRSPAFGDEGPTWADRGKDEETKLIGRYGNEVEFLNLLLWYGIISTILYFFLYLRASYLAIYQSRSIFMKAIGIYVAFLWAWAFIWEVSNFEIYFMMNIVFLGVCFSKYYRSMNDKDFKRWINSIFTSSRRIQ